VGFKISLSFLYFAYHSIFKFEVQHLIASNANRLKLTISREIKHQSYLQIINAARINSKNFAYFHILWYLRLYIY